MSDMDMGDSGTKGMGDGDITSDDKLWAMLAYVLTPLVPIIILFMEDKKARSFIRAHNAQALVWGIITAIVGTVTVGCGWIILWAIGAYWGFTKAYKGEYVEIPVLTDFVKNQGWA